MGEMVVDKLIEGWTQEERDLIYSALSKWHIGEIKINTRNTRLLPLAGFVGARQTAGVVARSYSTFQPRKLLILEPKFEQIEYETVVETIAAKIEKKWWRTCILEPQRTITKTFEHKRVVNVPRSIWRIQGMFFGSTVQFPMQKTISGDLFGFEENGLTFDGPVFGGIDVTLQVENTTSQEMPFNAVLLGEKVDMVEDSGTVSQ